MPRENWILTMVFVAAFPGACRTENGSKPPGDVLFVVNGAPISKHDFESSVRQAERAGVMEGQKLTVIERFELGRRMLFKLIQDELLVQHARSLGFSVPSEALDAQMAAAIEAGGGEEAYLGYLSESGLDVGEARANLERNLLLAQLAGHVSAGVSVPDEEIEAYYLAHREGFPAPEAVELAHIRLAAGESQEDPLPRAKQVKAEIDRGLAFDQAAAKFSDDRATREQGGSLGFLSRGEMLPELEDAAFSLAVGAVTEPIRAPDGLHLLKVLGRRPAGTKPLPEVRGPILHRLLDRKAQEQMELLTRQLIQTAVFGERERD